MKPEIIGLMGAAGCGKDTVAEMLCRKNECFRQDSFAKPLYEALAAMLGTTVNHLQKRSVKDAAWPGLNVTVRHLLQTLGTEWGRALVDQDLWLKLAMERHARRKVRFGKVTVMSDVRFENEAQWVKDEGGLLLFVSRPTKGLPTAHISEEFATSGVAHKVIVNTGSLQDLEVAIEELYQRLI